MRVLDLNVLTIGFLALLPLAAGITQAQNGSSIYAPRFGAYRESTPRFKNVTGVSGNPMIRALQHQQPANYTGLQRRADNGLPTGTCAPGTPCSNGACCSNTGVCGYSPNECGSDVCLSNCDAKAECGEYSEGGSVSCPLNVCCSEFGFCGTTDDFCIDKCQTGFGTCGSVSEPSCSGSSATKRTIGYYEGWASQRQCDTFFPADIDVTAMTHINFAFVYFHPTTFEITPKDASDIPLYSQFTALKENNPTLQTWVSLGGWAFNDATNSPNTQTAFSDMSSSAANRQAFAASLIHFMDTYGFDGVDIDWEYPGADDRGGVTADTANFALLLSDLKAAFRGRYGISVTLPSSYWYLRWFDLQAMEKSVDFFNFMSYDIHGVWDSSSKFTGPYVRPHTNLTEIRQGLDLLWRNDISPSQVNLGLGWYGRSFTLKDPSCNTPGCIFSEGGTAGECTNSGGTLSNAEIRRIITSQSLTPTMDREAAVKWITWDSNQWVSYDDGETMQMKLQAASELCLGGTMIWSIDQDGTDNGSSNDLMGIGTANGVSTAEAKTLREWQTTAKTAATIQNSCYWSFCGDQCATGFISEAYAKGQVMGIETDMNCEGDEIKTLCCAPGTNTGTCSWSGWRGVGMACATGYCPDGSDLIAVNTNSYVDNSDMGVISNLTCNGGSQSYCCSGFVPSSLANTDSLKLVGQDSLSKRDIDLVPSFHDQNQKHARDIRSQKALSKRDSKSNEDPACLFIGVSLASILGAGVVLSFGRAVYNTYGGYFTTDAMQEIYNMCVKPSEVVAHEKAAGDAGTVASAAAQFGQGAVGPGITELNTVTVKTTITGQPEKVPTTYGSYSRETYSTDIKECSLTYTCHYGRSFDEICDNQRYAIEQGLNHQTVFHAGARPDSTYKDTWNRKRGSRWYKSIRGLPGGRYTCELDEFPLGSMKESSYMAYQIIRFVNGPANGRQGQDWNDWLQAEYRPCILELGQARIAEEYPNGIPVTWKFSPFPEGDRRGNAILDGQHFLQYYGFDSQTRDSSCWATFTYQGTSTVSDQGFRVLPDDPMYAHPYDWPAFNNYRAAPGPDNLPTEIFEAQWLKREVARSVLQKDLPLSAIGEAEVAVHKLKKLDSSTELLEAKPTDPAMFSTDLAKNSDRTSHQPLETGSSHARSHLHGHGHRKWHY